MSNLVILWGLYVIRIVVAVFLGAVATELLGRFGTRFNFKSISSWNLAHGYFLIVWPSMAIGVYVLLGFVPPFKKKKPIQSSTAQRP
jgi:hypothetical protein